MKLANCLTLNPLLHVYNFLLLSPTPVNAQSHNLSEKNPLTIDLSIYTHKLREH
jgi:hypothetical protein